MASSASLTTTHLPTLRGLLDEWRGKQSVSAVFTAPMVDIAAKLAEKSATGAAQGKDIVVAFRTRPPLPNEAAEKFHAYETKDTDSEGVEDEGQTQHAEAASVEFCAGVSVKNAEPGTFVAHVPGHKVSYQHIYANAN